MSHDLKKFKLCITRCINNENQQLSRIKCLNRLRSKNNPNLIENPIYGHNVIAKKYLPLKIDINIK